MKLIRIFLALILLLVSSVSWGDEARRDGNWWQTQEQGQKLSYVVGFFDGMYLGNSFSYWKFVDGTKSQKVCAGLVLDSFTEFQKKFLNNVTNGQVVDGLDTFYSDYKNRRILVSNAVWLVANGIAGMPESKMNVMIESWRRSSN